MMFTGWLWAMASVLAVSLVSLAGMAVLVLSERTMRNVLPLLIGLAVGCLLGDAFLHLLPEAWQSADDRTEVGLAVLVGMLPFFALERLLELRHGHDLRSVQPFGYMNLVADGVHNFLDGLAIGAAYLAGFDVGVATTLAVLLHEVPQELGDFGILLKAGFSRSRVLLLNLASASLAVCGAILALVVGNRAEVLTNLLLPVTAGGFIYIAAADMLPEMHAERDLSRTFLQLLSILLGVGLMFLLTRLE